MPRIIMAEVKQMVVTKSLQQSQFCSAVYVHSALWQLSALVQPKDHSQSCHPGDMPRIFMAEVK